MYICESIANLGYHHRARGIRFPSDLLKDPLVSLGDTHFDKIYICLDFLNLFWRFSSGFGGAVGLGVFFCVE